MLFKKKIIFNFIILTFFMLIFPNITVNAGSLPIAVIGMSPQQNITTTTVVEFSADASIPSDGAVITSTSWGGDFSLTGLYTEGEHTVTLTVKDSNGLTSNTESITFVVSDVNTTQKPVAVIKMSPENNITNMTMVNFSINECTTFNGHIADAEWDNMKVKYPAGIHTVKLRIKDDLGVWSDWAEKTFTVTEEGKNTEIPTGTKKPFSIIENTGTTTFKVDETREFDLKDLSFTIRYGDDTTTTIPVTRTDITMDSKYRDIGYVTSDNVLHLYNDVEYDDYLFLTFSYTERNYTVKANLRFVYTRSNSIGLIKSVTTNVTEIQISRKDTFYFKDILFHILYDNGYQENIDGSKMNYFISEDFKKAFYVDDSSLSDGIKITPMYNVATGTEAYVEFYLKTDSFYENTDPNIPIQTFKKYIKFIIIDEDEEYITENSIDYISTTDPVVGISDGEKLQIDSLNFIAHTYNGQLRKLYPTTFTLNIQYKYKQLINYDEVNRTISFKETTPYNTEIVLNFVYNKNGITKTVDVKVIYAEQSPNHGSEISPIFTDISGHWAQNDIIQMSLKNMVVGYSGSLYFPNKMTTRAEVASFISKYLELDKKEINDIETSTFTDVLKYDNSFEDIEKVYRAGIFQGYGDGTFLPDANITRQELAVVLYRTYQYKTGLALSGNNVPYFLDDYSISEWAKPYIYAAKAIGIIQGREDGKFYPLDNTTRAEITAMLNRMLNN